MLVWLHSDLHCYPLLDGMGFMLKLHHPGSALSGSTGEPIFQCLRLMKCQLPFTPHTSIHALLALFLTHTLSFPAILSATMFESKKFYFLLKENLEYIYISVKIFNSLIFQLSSCFLLDIHKSLLDVIFSEKFSNRTSALVTKNFG